MTNDLASGNIRTGLLGRVREGAAARIARAAATRSCFAIATGAVSLLAVGLIAATGFDPRWTMYLFGVLSAALVASWSHGANARWTIARRNAQLRVTREKLGMEARLRAHAEQRLARSERAAQYLDESLPAMVSYIDGEGVVRYHNRAYARWLRLPDAQIDGRRLEEVVGRSTYGEIRGRVEEAQAGHEVRYESTRAMQDGERFRLFAQYLPHYDAGGKVAGVFSILTDITGARELGLPPDGAVAEECDAAARLVKTLERDEFCLYSQPFAPLHPTKEPGLCMEVLLRLREEEENHLPAGMFIPAAEEAGLMPQIDRWVVRKVISLASDPTQTYFVNVSPSTIAEPGFAEFVQAELAARGRDGRSLCFEFWEQDVVGNPCAYRDFTAFLAKRGCRFAVSCSGSSRLTVPLMRELHVSFVKLDGCMVLNGARDAAGLERIRALNVAAHAAGMATIGECVEDEAARAALARAGTDFAQGFGIAAPRLLKTPARGIETSCLAKAA